MAEITTRAEALELVAALRDGERILLETRGSYGQLLVGAGVELRGTTFWFAQEGANVELVPYSPITQRPDRVADRLVALFKLEV